MRRSQSRFLNVLVVEDNESDSDLITEVFVQCGLKSKVRVSPNGREAYKVITSENPPDIVLLDLNLGIMGGLDLLDELNENYPEFVLKVPIIVLTSSNRPKDINNAISKGAKCYHVKPMNFKEYMLLIKVIYSHWLDYAFMPPLKPTKKKLGA